VKVFITTVSVYIICILISFISEVGQLLLFQNLIWLCRSDRVLNGLHVSVLHIETRFMLSDNCTDLCSLWHQTGHCKVVQGYCPSTGFLVSGASLAAVG